MRLFCLLLAGLSFLAHADELPLRPSASLLFKDPDLLRAGQCARYEEGGGGWVMTDPQYFVRGTVVSNEIRSRHLGVCPFVPGKNIDQYTRAEFNRFASAYPCVMPGMAERDEQIGMVRLRVSDWETPHARRTENSGRLHRGTFIDRPLAKDMEIELEADLLTTCQN